MSDTPSPEKVLPYLTLRFDENGDLKSEYVGMNLFTLIGILRAATLKFESLMTTAKKASPRVESHHGA